MKYKVGDRVRIKKDLRSTIFQFPKKAFELEGKIVTITKESREGYLINETGSFMWFSEMFEGLAKLTKKEVEKKMKQLPSFRLNVGKGNKTYILKDDAVKLMQKLEESEGAKELAYKQAVASGVIEVDDKEYLVTEQKNKQAVPRQWVVSLTHPDGHISYVKSLEIRSHYKFPSAEDTPLLAEALEFDTKEKAESITSLIGDGEVIEVGSLDD